jgi:hypothetical protein
MIGEKERGGGLKGGKGKEVNTPGLLRAGKRGQFKI